MKELKITFGSGETKGMRNGKVKAPFSDMIDDTVANAEEIR